MASTDFKQGDPELVLLRKILTRLNQLTGGGGGGGGSGAVDSVNGQTGVVELDASDVGALESITSGNQVWVDAVYGNDGTGLVQRHDKPFLTVSAAVAAISDASTSKRYIVNIAPGSYLSETRDIFKSWVFLNAQQTGSFDNETVHLQTLGGGSFKIPIEAGSSLAIFGAAGVSFDSYINLNLANTRSYQAIFKGCTFLSGMENSHGAGGNFISFELFNCVFEDVFTSNNGYVIGMGNFFQDVALAIPQSCPNAFGSTSKIILLNSPSFGSVSLNNASTSGVNGSYLINCANFGLSFTNTGGNAQANVNVSIDSSSIPIAASYSVAGWTVNRMNDVFQPLDSDLTAIAALSTTAYGRAFLELANATAGRAALGLGTAATQNTGAFDAAGAAAAAAAASQPLDSDLTAIAALTTTSYGRAFLELADAAAARTALALKSGALKQALSIVSISGNTTVDSTYDEALVRCTANLTLQLDNVATNSRIYVTSVGDNLITFSPGSGMSITGSTTLGGNGATATLIQISATVWEIYSQSPSTSLHTGLFAFYPLDETASTTTRRDIVGGETVTATAGTASAAGKTRLRAVLMAAAANQAYLSTTGAGDFKFNRGAGALTVAGWVKATSLTNAATLASMFTTTGNKRIWFLDVSTAGKARFAINTDGTSGGTLLATSTATLVTGTWYFLVGYYNPTTGKVGIIVNAGTPDETTAGAGMFVTTAIAMNIGAQESSATVSAALQDIAFWSRNLTTAEVARLYNSGNGLTYPFLA